MESFCTIPSKRTMLFIDDRPCGQTRPCSFNYKLFQRSDINPILIRFRDTFSQFSNQYISLTKNFESFHILPEESVESGGQRLKNWLNERSLTPDCFCCMSEPQQEFGNALGRYLGLEVLPSDSVHALRHKPTMKEWFLSAGLQTASFRTVKTASDVDSFANEHKYPVILKPTMGWGTLRTVKIEKRDLISDYLHLIESGEEMMVESFNPDEEFEVCALIHDAKVLDVFVSKMPAPPLEITKGSISANISIGAFKEELNVDFTDITQRIVNRFGIKRGYLHMEWFINPFAGNAIIGECALRYPGCEIAKNHGLANGFDMANSTVDLYIGRRFTSSI